MISLAKYYKDNNFKKKNLLFILIPLILIGIFNLYIYSVINFAEKNYKKTNKEKLIIVKEIEKGEKKIKEIEQIHKNFILEIGEKEKIIYEKYKYNLKYIDFESFTFLNYSSGIFKNELSGFQLNDNYDYCNIEDSKYYFNSIISTTKITYAKKIFFGICKIKYNGKTYYLKEIFKENIIKQIYGNLKIQSEIKEELNNIKNEEIKYYKDLEKENQLLYKNENNLSDINKKIELFYNTMEKYKKYSYYSKIILIIAIIATIIFYFYQFLKKISKRKKLNQKIEYKYVIIEETIKKDEISIQTNNSKNNYGTICITNKGESVKSKAEKAIADFLFSKKIDYIYEKDLIWNGKKVANPDFYLTKYDVYIEFWGLMNDVNYKIKRRYKIKKFQEYGIKHINLYRNDIFGKYGYFEKRLSNNIFNKSKELNIFVTEL